MFLFWSFDESLTSYKKYRFFLQRALSWQAVLFQDFGQFWAVSVFMQMPNCTRYRLRVPARMEFAVGRNKSKLVRRSSCWLICSAPSFFFQRWRTSLLPKRRRTSRRCWSARPTSVRRTSTTRWSRQLRFNSWIRPVNYLPHSTARILFEWPE